MKKKIKKLRADLAFNIIGFIVLLLLLLSLITGVVGYAAGNYLGFLMAQLLAVL